VGFVKDGYLGKEYVGFNCAACHTGQVNYKGVAIRIDGGPAGSDMDSMLQKLAQVMRATLDDKIALAAFEKRVLDRGNYSSARVVDADLENFYRQLTMYLVVNSSPTRYGYYRFDALGRTYNRVLEHIITQEQLNAVMQDIVANGGLTKADFDVLKDNARGDNALTSKQRDHLVFRMAQVLPLKAQLYLRNMLFIPPDAPATYPFLWDFPQHDYVRWDVMASNRRWGLTGRNVGEMIGAFATLDWAEESGVTLNFLINRETSSHASFKSSINVHNLRRLERHLERLQSPEWPKDILPRVDMERSERGKVLFAEHCASCHSTIQRSEGDHEGTVHFIRLTEVRTDPKMTENAANYEGLSGFLRNEYVSSGGSTLLIKERERVAALLARATFNVVVTPSPNKNFMRRSLDWADDLVTSFSNNNKLGSHLPDPIADSHAFMPSYPARSLNGIWATAPYLHNGSVPTLYDLLLPTKALNALNDPADPPDAEFRPDKFMVGSREFDPEKVGLKSSGYDGFVFNTRLPGNSNTGHQYGTRSLSKEQRFDLLEYLKTL
jgi:hypothetical protein